MNKPRDAAIYARTHPTSSIRQPLNFLSGIPMLRRKEVKTVIDYVMESRSREAMSAASVSSAFSASLEHIQVDTFQSLAIVAVLCGLTRPEDGPRSFVVRRGAHRFLLTTYRSAGDAIPRRRAAACCSESIAPLGRPFLDVSPSLVTRNPSGDAVRRPGLSSRRWRS